MAFINIDPEAIQLGRNITTCSLTIVGKKQKRDLLFEQTLDEFVGAINQFAAAINDAIHVN